MKFFFNRRTVLIIALLMISQFVKGQEYINPTKNLSVSQSSDTLLFKELVSNKLMFKLRVKKGTASHFIKFSPSGNFMITSGTADSTNLYLVDKDKIILTATLPLVAEEAVFNASEKELFLLHCKSLFSTSFSSYSTVSCKKLASTSLPFSAQDLTINASGSLLGFCESTNLHTLHTSNLTKDNMYWQGSVPRLLTFNPVIPDQAASVNKENHIQIRDIKKDTVLMEIKAHGAKIVWLGYDPTGTLLVSLDNRGHLFTWMPSLKKCVAQLKGLSGIPVFHPNGTLNLSANGHGEEPGFVRRRENAVRQSLHGRNYFVESEIRNAGTKRMAVH